MLGSDTSGSDETVEERVPGGRVGSWLLLDANRWLVAGMVAGGLFAALVVLGALDPVPLRATLSRNNSIATLFQALLTAVATGVTLVVTINQVVLSQELGAAVDQRERMEGAVEFQREIEATLGGPVGSPDPTPFLRALVEESASRAERLADSFVATDADRLHEEVTTYVREVRADAASVGRRLEGTEFGDFDLLDAALDFDYSVKLYEARRLRQEHGETLGGDARDALDDIAESLELFGAAREHFKTLYFQWALVDLSRSVLYTAVPALLVTSSMVVYVDPATITGTTAGVDNLVWVVSGAVGVALLPFALLLSYVLRIATVAKRTLAIGPFVLRTRNVDRD